MKLEEMSSEQCIEMFKTIQGEFFDFMQSMVEQKPMAMARVVLEDDLTQMIFSSFINGFLIAHEIQPFEFYNKLEVTNNVTH